MSQGPVAILGAGTQGRRLAYMWSSCGSPVHLIDRDPAQLEGAKLAFERFKQDGVVKDHKGGELRAFLAEDKESAFEGVWLVVECVPESLNLKRTVLKELDGAVDKDAIIASNSSSYTITEIMEGVKLSHPERFVSLHSYWPPETPVMPSAVTRDSIVPLLMQECKNHSFSPYHVKKSSTGYIYNRIWAAIKREALYVAAEGVASPEEIDAIYKDVLKTPKGPFEQMDIVGLDVVNDIEQHYADERGGLPEAPRELLKGMIKEGKLGVKTGEGFYKYDGE